MGAGRSWTQERDQISESLHLDEELCLCPQSIQGSRLSILTKGVI